MVAAPRFAVVAPMLNEAGNIEQMAREIDAACTPVGPFEAIFVNDGSTDDSSVTIAALRTEFPWLREVRHAEPCGQSAAVRSGVLAAHAPVICTIDGDGQNPPAEIPKLVAPLLGEDEGPGIVAGQRVDNHANGFTDAHAVMILAGAGELDRADALQARGPSSS